MSTLNKVFAFATTLEGFSAVPGGNATLSYDSGVGNPAGSTKSNVN